MVTPEILNDPLLLAILTLVVFAIFQYQRTLTWTEYRYLHNLKRRFAPVVDRHTNLFVLSRKGYRDDKEYLMTVDGPVRRVWRSLVRAGGSPHLLNSVKQRPTPTGEMQLSSAHVVWTHADGTQTECYLFENENGSVDVYAHHEATVLDPQKHLTGFQSDGDPYDVVLEALTNTQSV